MTATKLIVLRVLLAIIAVFIFQISETMAILTILLFLFAELIDVFDGILADAKGHRKPFGGFLDIAADQCIETLFWFLLLQYNLVPLWIPAFILVRNTFINLLRIQAISIGHAMFGSGSMLRSQFAHLLVGTRLSRGIMVVVKIIGFVTALLLQISQRYGATSIPLLALNEDVLRTTSICSLALLAIIHLIRGAILTWEARDSLDAFLWSPESAASRTDRSGRNICD